MNRVVYSGEYRAVWSPDDRRWYAYGPGAILMEKFPGRREDAVYYLRRMQGLPTRECPARRRVAHLIPR